MTENERLTMTDEEMDEIRQYAPDFDCPIKAYEGSVTNLFCESVCDEFQNNCPFMKTGKRLKCYEDIGTIDEFKALKEKSVIITQSDIDTFKADYREKHNNDIPEKDYELEMLKEKTKQLEIKERCYKEHGERLYV